MNNRGHHKYRIAYISGPVDAAEVVTNWRNKGNRTNFFGTIYLEQFLDVCDEIDAELYVVTTLPEKSSVRSVDGFTVHNRPLPLNSTGITYHIRSVGWVLGLLPHLIRFRPDVVVSTAMQNYWFVLCVLRLFGVRLVSSLHCTILSHSSQRKFAHKVLQWLNRSYYCMCMDQLMVVSSSIKEQAQLIYGLPSERIHEFIPTYKSGDFISRKPRPFDQLPFTVMFCGRIEVNKGVYDLLDVARMLKVESPTGFRFHFCGEGSELAGLHRAVNNQGLDDIVFVHGHCNVKLLTHLIEECHIFVVPTRSEFEEGFNKVVAEGVMCLKPVVTSKVCPALKYAPKSVVEVEPDDVMSYYSAILELSRSKDLYMKKIAGCLLERVQFFDLKNSYGAALRDVLREVLTG